MTDVNFPLTADSDFDDLPRTLRREKEKRAREARDARDRRERERQTMDASRGEPPSYFARAMPAPAHFADDPVAAAVRRFEVPFFHLVMFFMKVALAAIPALMVLGVGLYFAGQALEAYIPDLVRMKILVTFPGG